MILAVDIGNTNIVVGGYQGEELCFSVRLSTDATRTSYEYAAILDSALGLYQVDLPAVKGAIVSSVVPPLSTALCQAVQLLCPEVEPMLVGAGMKTGLNIRIDNPKELGADLLAAAVGAMVKYPLPAIVVDLGTATKILVVDENKCFLGGSIMAGVMISAASYQPGQPGAAGDWHQHCGLHEVRHHPGGCQHGGRDDTAVSGCYGEGGHGGGLRRPGGAGYPPLPHPHHPGRPPAAGRSAGAVP